MINVISVIDLVSEIETTSEYSSPFIVVICGLPRSGTTLLSTQLQRRCGVVCVSETHFFFASRKGSGINFDSFPAEVQNDAYLRAAYSKLDLQLKFKSVESFRILIEYLTPTNHSIA